MIELQKTKGKPWIAAAGVRPAAEAQPFPQLACDSVESNTSGDYVLPHAFLGKVSLVVISFKQFGFAQLESWIAPFESSVMAPERAAAASGGGGDRGQRNRKRKAGKGGGGTPSSSSSLSQAGAAVAAASGSVGGGGGLSSGSSTRPSTQVVQVSAMEGGFVANLLKGSVKVHMT